MSTPNLVSRLNSVVLFGAGAPTAYRETLFAALKLDAEMREWVAVAGDGSEGRSAVVAVTRT